MEIKNTFGVIENLFAQKSGKTAQGTPPSQNAPPPPPPKTGESKDIVAVSNNNAATKLNQVSKLLSDNVEKLENGFRRVQEFETAKGNKFTRIEEVTNGEDRSKRMVIQQNESGSITVSENILDRQVDGSFRQTQRFTDAAGETKTNIELKVSGNNINQILGIASAPNSKAPQPFEALRGTQYDVVV